MGDGQLPAQGEASHGSPLSQKESPVAPLSHWLQLMLAEIDRKREEQERGRAEAVRRAEETAATVGARGEPGGSENPPLP